MHGKDCDQVFGPDLILTIDREARTDGQPLHLLIQAIRDGKPVASGAWTATEGTALAHGVWRNHQGGGNFWLYEQGIAIDAVFFTLPAP